jgi:hypothetical protein
VSREDIVRHAWIQYHGRRITLRQLLAVIATWRPR